MSDKKKEVQNPVLDPGMFKMPETKEELEALIQAESARSVIYNTAIDEMISYIMQATKESRETVMSRLFGIMLARAMIGGMTLEALQLLVTNMYKVAEISK